MTQQSGETQRFYDKWLKTQDRIHKIKMGPQRYIHCASMKARPTMCDTYWAEPKASYEQRRQLYLEYCASHSPGGRTGFFSQLARLEMGCDPVDEKPVREAIAFVDTRQDCSVFSVGGLLRILYLYRDSPLIPRDLIAEIEACLLRFKYSWDEPGDDRRCYHTENHQIIFERN